MIIDALLPFGAPAVVLLVALVVSLAWSRSSAAPRRRRRHSRGGRHRAIVLGPVGAS